MFSTANTCKGRVCGPETIGRDWQRRPMSIRHAFRLSKKATGDNVEPGPRHLSIDQTLLKSPPGKLGMRRYFAVYGFSSRVTKICHVNNLGRWTWFIQNRSASALQCEAYLRILSGMIGSGWSWQLVRCQISFLEQCGWQLLACWGYLYYLFY